MTLKSVMLPAFVLVGAIVAPTPATSTPAQSPESESLIIQTSGSLSSLRQRIESLGGRVTRSYGNLNAVTAELPASALGGLPYDANVTRDVLVAAPGPIYPFREGSVRPQATPLNDIPHLGATPITNIRRFARSLTGLIIMVSRS